MAVEKFSASMDAELLEAARRAARAEGSSLSAWLADATRHRLRLLGLERLVHDYEAEHGAFSDAEIARARRELERARGESRAARRRRAS